MPNLDSDVSKVSIKGVMELALQDLCPRAWAHFTLLEKNRGCHKVAHPAVPEIPLRASLNTAKVAEALFDADDVFQATEPRWTVALLRRTLIRQLLRSQAEDSTLPTIVSVPHEKHPVGCRKHGKDRRGAKSHERVDALLLEHAGSKPQTAALIVADFLHQKRAADLATAVSSQLLAQAGAVSPNIQVLSGITRIAVTMLSPEDPAAQDSDVRSSSFLSIFTTANKCAVTSTCNEEIIRHVFLPLLHVLCSSYLPRRLASDLADLLSGGQAADLEGCTAADGDITEVHFTDVIHPSASDAAQRSRSGPWTIAVPLHYASSAAIKLAEASTTVVQICVVDGDEAKLVELSECGASASGVTVRGGGTIILRFQSAPTEVPIVVEANCRLELAASLAQETSDALVDLQLQLAAQLAERHTTDNDVPRHLISLHRGGLSAWHPATEASARGSFAQEVLDSPEDLLLKVIQCRRNSLHAARKLFALLAFHLQLSHFDDDRAKEVATFVRVHSDSLDSSPLAAASADALHTYFSAVVPCLHSSAGSTVSMCDAVFKLWQRSEVIVNGTLIAALDHQRELCETCCRSINLITGALRRLQLGGGHRAVSALRRLLMTDSLTERVKGAGPDGEERLSAATRNAIRLVVGLLRVQARSLGRVPAHKVLLGDFPPGRFVLATLALLCVPLEPTDIEACCLAGVDELVDLLPIATDFSRSMSFQVMDGEEEESDALWQSMAEVHQVCRISHDNSFPKHDARKPLVLDGSTSTTAVNPVPNPSLSRSSMIYFEVKAHRVDVSGALVLGIVTGTDGSDRASHVLSVDSHGLICGSDCEQVGTINAVSNGDIVGFAVVTEQRHGIVRQVLLFVNGLLAARVPIATDAPLRPFITTESGHHVVEAVFGPEFEFPPLEHHPSAHTAPTQRLVWAAAPVAVHLLLTRCRGFTGQPLSFPRRLADHLVSRITSIADAMRNDAGCAGAHHNHVSQWGPTERVKLAAMQHIHCQTLQMHLCSLDYTDNETPQHAQLLTLALMPLVHGNVVHRMPQTTRCVLLSVLERKLHQLQSPTGMSEEAWNLLANVSAEDVPYASLLDPDIRGPNACVDGSLVYFGIADKDAHTVAMGQHPLKRGAASISFTITRRNGVPASLGRLYFVGLVSRKFFKEGDPRHRASYMNSKFLEAEVGVYCIGDYIDLGRRNFVPRGCDVQQLLEHRKNWRVEADDVVFGSGDVITVVRNHGVSFFRNGLPLGTLFAAAADDEELYPFMALYNDDCSGIMLPSGPHDFASFAHRRLVRQLLSQQRTLDNHAMCNALVRARRRNALSPLSFLQVLGADGDELHFMLGGEMVRAVSPVPNQSGLLEVQGVQSGVRQLVPEFALIRCFSVQADAGDFWFYDALVTEVAHLTWAALNPSEGEAIDLSLAARGLRVLLSAVKSRPELASTQPRLHVISDFFASRKFSVVAGGATGPFPTTRVSNGDIMIDWCWMQLLGQRELRITSSNTSPSRQEIAPVLWAALVTPALSALDDDVPCFSGVWTANDWRMELRTRPDGTVEGDGHDSRGRFTAIGFADCNVRLDLMLHYSASAVERTASTASDEQWACDACTFINPNENARCEICGSARPGSWACGACSYAFNPQTQTQCAMCGQRGGQGRPEHVLARLASPASERSLMASCSGCGAKRPITNFLTFCSVAACEACHLEEAQWLLDDAHIMRLEATLDDNGTTMEATLSTAGQSTGVLLQRPTTTRNAPCRSEPSYVMPNPKHSARPCSDEPYSQNKLVVSVTSAMVHAATHFASLLTCACLTNSEGEADNQARVARLLTRIDVVGCESVSCFAKLDLDGIREIAVQCMEQGPSPGAAQVCGALCRRLREIKVAERETEVSECATGLLTCVCALACLATEDSARNEFTAIACELLEHHPHLSAKAATKLFLSQSKSVERLRVLCAMRGLRRRQEDVKLQCIALILEVVRRITEGLPLPAVMDQTLCGEFPHWIALTDSETTPDGRLVVGQLRGSARAATAGGGRHYYEVVAPADGPKQVFVGWGTLSHERENANTHVGGDLHSFGFNLRGELQLLGGRRPYALTAPLHPGDTVGALIDFGGKKACWSVNGVAQEWIELPLGEAEDLYPYVSANVGTPGLEVRLQNTRFCPPDFRDFSNVVDLVPQGRSSHEAQDRTFYIALCRMINELESSGVSLETVMGTSNSQDWRDAAVRASASLPPIGAFLTTHDVRDIRPYVLHLQNLSELSVIASGKTECLRDTTLWTQFSKAQELFLFSARWATLSRHLQRCILRSRALKTITIDRDVAQRLPSSPQGGPQAADDLFLKSTVFGQVFAQADSDSVFRHNPMFTVKFVNDISEDNGGLFRTTMSMIAEELMQHPSSLFKRTSHSLFTTFVPDRRRKSAEDLKLFKWLGCVMANAVITGSFVLAIDLPRIVWKRLVREDAVVEEYYFDCDDTVRGAVAMDDFLLDDEYFRELCSGMNDGMASTDLQASTQGDVCVRRTHIQRLLLHQYDAQIDSMREGLLQILPSAVMSNMLWSDLQRRVCGVAAISFEDIVGILDMELLHERTKTTFLDALRLMSTAARSQFLLFCTGQSRLPVPERVKVVCGDDCTLYPTAHTCAPITLTIQDYKDSDTMCEKLQVASAHAREFGFV